MKNKALVGRLALLCATLIWGSSFFILKNAIDDISVLWVLAIRFLIASVVFFLFSGRKLIYIGKEGVKGGITLGFFLAAAYIVQTYGLKYTTPGKNAFLTSTYCLLVPLMSWILTKKKPKFSTLLATIICFTGIGFVSLDSGQDNLNIGDVLTVLCGFFYAAQIIATDRFVKDCDTVCLSAVEFFVSGIICLAGAIFFEPAPSGLDLTAWVSIGYLAVFCTGICFFLQTWAIKYVPPTTAAVLMTTEAVFGTLFSVIFYHEVLSMSCIIGFLLILIAIIGNELFNR